LPHKTYSTPVQEKAVAIYLVGRLGLRKVVKLFVGYRPGYVTLWGWVGGIGRYALEGNKAMVPASLFSVVVTETKKRWLPDLYKVYDRPVTVNPQRYLIERRRDEMEAAKKLLRVAMALARALDRLTVAPLAMWICLIFKKCPAARISWWATSPFTPFELRLGKASQLPLPTSSSPVDKEVACPIRNRGSPDESQK
jgi:hypothetical protein